MITWFVKIVECFLGGKWKKGTKEMAIKFKNESERLEKEWVELDERNVPLKGLIKHVGEYTQNKFNKEIVITMIYRTDDEQESIYQDNERYKAKPFKSPHQFYQAVDLRSRTFTEEEIEDLVEIINSTYNMPNYYNWTAKCHNVGKGDHFHIQFYEA